MNSEICDVVCNNPVLVEQIRRVLPERDHLQELSELFKVLGDATRIRILSALLHSELCVCDLVAVLGMTQSAVSHQLRVLRSAKVVKFRKEGRNVYYSLDDTHIHELIQQGMDHVMEDWVVTWDSAGIGQGGS